MTKTSQNRSGMFRAFGGYDDHVRAQAEKASNLALVAGYTMSSLAGLRLLRTFRERRLRRFLVFQAGTGLVAAGLAVRGRWIAATANAVTGALLWVAWLVTGRKLRR